MCGPFAFFSAAADTVAPLGRAVSAAATGDDAQGRVRAFGVRAFDQGGDRWRPVRLFCRRPGMPPGTTCDYSACCGYPDVAVGEFGEDVEGPAAVLSRGR